MCRCFVLLTGRHPQLVHNFASEFGTSRRFDDDSMCWHQGLVQLSLDMVEQVGGLMTILKSAESFQLSNNSSVLWQRLDGDLTSHLQLFRVKGGAVSRLVKNTCADISSDREEELLLEAPALCSKTGSKADCR